MKLFETIQKNNYNLLIDSSLSYDETKKNTIRRFIAFCIKELSLSGNVTIKLVDDRKSNKIMTTAFYRHSDQTAMIYAKNRMLVDIMRSLAHELVHMQQWEQDLITLPVPDIGGSIEDGANAMAGVIIKKFLKYDSEGDKLIEGVI